MPIGFAPIDASRRRPASGRPFAARDPDAKVEPLQGGYAWVFYATYSDGKLWSSVLVLAPLVPNGVIDTAPIERQSHDRMSTSWIS